MLGCPFKFDAFSVPSDDFVGQLGEHTQEILAELLGMTAEEAAALKE